MAKARKVPAAELGGYLIYHPQRQVSVVDGVRVYHDSFQGNQDPYVWSERFLHSYCHITQLSPRRGHINFWVSGDQFPDFSRLYCDLVFVVDRQDYWADRNHIGPHDPLVESEAAFEDHYQFAYQHPLQRRRRYTLKADPVQSFQPQAADRTLIDLLPMLAPLGLAQSQVVAWLTDEIGSRPMKLSQPEVEALYQSISEAASVQLRGATIQRLRDLINA